MRKEVKLGMTIGGGLIALLVVYMLVAPPSSQNKGGTQLVVNDKGGDIIDTPPTEATQVSDDKGAARAPADNTGGLPLGKVPNVQPTKPQPQEQEQLTPPVKDGWNEELNQGHKAAAEKTHPAGEKTTKPAPKPSKPSPTKPAVTRGEPHEPHEVIALGSNTQASEAKLYFNPNEAWGGGVSSNAVFGDSEPVVKKKAGSHKELTQSTPAPTGGGGKYVVKSGDTLSSIAQATYGSASYYPHILRANPTVNPNNLKLGTELTLPKAEDVKATDTPREHGIGVAASISQDVKIDTTHQYRVQSGDSLYKISLKVYGKSTYVEKIYDLNKGTIGSDPKKLKLGMVLELPEKTAVATTGNPGGSEGAEEAPR
jgi:LysM repeat protein